MEERRETCPAPQPKTAVDDEREHDENDENDGKLLDLPPLGHDEEEGGDEGFDDLLQTLDDAEQGLDDANASDLEIGVELALDDGGTGEDEPAEEGVDVGALHEGIAEADASTWLSDEAVEQSDAEQDDSTITAGRTATTAARKGRERTRRTTWTRGSCRRSTRIKTARTRAKICSQSCPISPTITPPSGMRCPGSSSRTRAPPSRAARSRWPAATSSRAAPAQSPG